MAWFPVGFVRIDEGGGGGKARKGGEKGYRSSPINFPGSPIYISLRDETHITSTRSGFNIHIFCYSITYTYSCGGVQEDHIVRGGKSPSTDGIDIDSLPRCSGGKLHHRLQR